MNCSYSIPSHPFNTPTSNTMQSPINKNRKKQLVGAFPFLFAELIFAFVYFAFVVRWIPTLFSLQVYSAVVEVLLFHVVFLLCQASFFKTTLTNPGFIPDGYLEQETAEEDEEEEVVGERGTATSSELVDSANADAEGLMATRTHPTEKGEKRKCKKCIKMKPDRAHHCSQCKQCILKMDHHCPWVNNCVGFHNYKFFVLFLTWTVILAAFVVVCLLAPCFSSSLYGNENKGRDPLLFVTFILGAVFGIGLALFAVTHYVYLSMNQTTIEMMEKRGKRGNIYNLGWRKNFTEVFGDNPLLWFIPVYTSKGDGLTYPTFNESAYV